MNRWKSAHREFTFSRFSQVFQHKNQLPDLPALGGMVKGRGDMIIAGKCGEIYVHD